MKLFVHILMILQNGRIILIFAEMEKGCYKDNEVSEL